MVFSSMTFLFMFLPIVLILYYLSPMKGKNLIILVSGLIFYAWGEPVYVVIMIFSTLVDYTAGRIMDKFDDNKRARLICLIISVIINLGLLGVFKYSSFVIGSLNSMFSLSIPDPQLPLPIGISFFTFQSMSYTMDLYMRHVKVQKNVISFTSYVSLFPQIVAGPIVRYADVANEIDSREIRMDMVASGIGIFIRGMAKKILLANNIGVIWTSVKAMENVPALTAWLGILAFTFQIYFDFSGYSDMAVGLGKMLGFNFPQNFDHPYTSKSVSEFWRRWHITLGSWFKSYVYFPLGGNRGGLIKTIRNLLIVWFLTGLWHGASVNFVMWGLYFGVIIIAERLFLGKILAKIPNIFSWLYTFLIVVFGWVLFEFREMAQIGSFMGALFGANGGADTQSLYLLMSNIVVFVACAIGSSNLVRRILKPTNLAKTTTKKAVAHFRTNFSYYKIAAELCLFIITICYLVNSSYNPFLYYNF